MKKLLALISLIAVSSTFAADTTVQCTIEDKLSQTTELEYIRTDYGVVNDLELAPGFQFIAYQGNIMELGYDYGEITNKDYGSANLTIRRRVEINGVTVDAPISVRCADMRQFAGF